MILAAINQTLEIDLAGAITTNNLPVSVEFTDITASAFTPGHQDAISNGTTAVTILAAPAGSTYRAVKHINVYNDDTVAATVWIVFNNNATLRRLCSVTLQPQETLTWSAEQGWQVAKTTVAASDTAPGIIEIAIQSEMEAGTDVLRAVTPGRFHFHPAACKCWGMAVGTGSLTTSYNITSITDTGTGRLGVTIATDFSSTSYAIIAQIQRGVTTLAEADVEQCAIRNASQTVTAFEIESYDHTATTLVADDPAQYYWDCYGDQA
jgi:hypothetical protein